jgi:hypothetical protein
VLLVTNDFDVLGAQITNLHCNYPATRFVRTDESDNTQ